MIEFVFDASAVLALLLGEPGGNLEHLLERAVISSVNLAEVRTKLLDLDKLDVDALDDDLRSLIRVEPFTESQAILAANLRKRTKHLGLSLGDRACIALAISLGAEAYTAEQQWAAVDLGCAIHLIR